MNKNIIELKKKRKSEINPNSSLDSILYVYALK